MQRYGIGRQSRSVRSINACALRLSAHQCWRKYRLHLYNEGKRHINLDFDCDTWLLVILHLH
jgi:hypothetical protein